jgi:hypothetical protein
MSSWLHIHCLHDEHPFIGGDTIQTVPLECLAGGTANEGLSVIFLEPDQRNIPDELSQVGNEFLTDVLCRPDLAAAPS